MKALFAAFACGAALVCASDALAQARIITDIRPGAQATAEQRAQVEALRRQPGAGELNIARVQAQTLRGATVGQTVEFRVTPSATVSARALSVQSAGGVTTWQGEVAGDSNRPPGTATLTITNAGVTGTIHGSDGRTYRLRPLPGGETAIVELNYRTMPPDHDAAGGGGGGSSQLREATLRARGLPPVATQVNPNVRVNPNVQATAPNIQAGQTAAPAADANLDSGARARLATNPQLLRYATTASNVSLVERYRYWPRIWEILLRPTINVLVVYTSSAQTASGDIVGLSNQAITETNGSFTNSNVWARVNLVGTMSVSYNEAGRAYATMTSHLSGTADGQMDNVHAQRNALAADVVVLIVNAPAACGRADAIGANAAQAFVVVHWDCATGYYSFGHEIGHLAGARHDEPTDTTDSPYVWGHGFRHSLPAGAGWRTIMGYNCGDGSCPSRLQYWSSPLSTWSGVAMGNAANADNHRVWNDRAATLAGFR